MTHDIYDHKEDLILPMENFLLKHTDYTFKCKEVIELKIKDELRVIPNYINSKLNEK